MSSEGGGGLRSGRGRRALALAALVCAAVAGGVLLGRTSTPEQAAAQREPERRTPVIGEAIEQRLADVRTGTCELSVARTPVAVPRGVDGGVVTAVHVRAGAPIEPGTRVIDVSGRPVIALALPFPMYRTIAPFDEGPDVEAVQKALVALGRYDGAPNGRHDAASQRAIRSLYEHVGAPAPTTGPEVAARAAAADQAIEALNAQIRSGGEVTRTEIDEAVSEREAARRAIGVPVPLGELVAPPAGRINTVDLQVGSTVGAGDTIAMVAGNAARARCTLLAGAGAGLTPAMTATLDLGAGDPLTGALGPLEADENGDLVAAFLPVKELPALLAGKTATVEVTVAATDGDVLTVPASALRSGPSGTQVDVVDGATRTAVAIETGLVASGWVEVTGGDLRAGDDVVLSEPAS